MPLYDSIGIRYSDRRRPDPRIFSRLIDALGDARSIVNVGAGTGSYEPRDRPLVAVEPSATMLRQRQPGAAPAVQAVAERLPFPDACFDAALAVLTLHHWRDQSAGLSELVRVARRRVVLLTWIPPDEPFWFFRDYFPEIEKRDRRIFPSLAGYNQMLGPCEVVPVAIPHDCTDGFLGAYWRRPRAYLDPAVRAAISSLARTPDSHPALVRLRADLNSGAWRERNAHLLELDELDLGYRIVVCDR